MGAGRLAALAGLCVSLGAADPAPGLNGIRQANLRADIGFLASGPLEGRRSLRRGADVAAQFIAAEFAKAGLQPAAGGSFFQPVPLVEYRVDENRATLAVERGGRRLFRYGADFRGSFPQDAAVRAPVVFAGYGIAAPEFGYDDYAGLDVRGKAVLIFEREPRQYDPDSVFNGLGNTRHVNAEVKARAAQRNGAAAVLLAVEPNRKRASSPRAAAAPGGGPRVPPPPAQALAESEIRIPVVRIGDAVLEALFAGAGKSPAALQSEIDATMKQASMPLSGAHVDLRIALEERRRGESANVAGLIPGRDPALAHETILFTAHYDHDGDWDGRLRPGADDNASGTAGLIELARAYARNPEPPRRTLLFLALTAEERGLLGAWHYVANPLRPLSGARAVINFDMIGRDETPSRQTDGLIEISPDTSNELGLIGTNYSPEYRAVVERENREIGLRLNYKWDADAALNVFQRSDHFPFAVLGIPAVWWFTGFHPEYHQTSDTPDRLNFAKMEKIVRLAYLAGWRFAEETRPPAFRAIPEK